MSRRWLLAVGFIATLAGCDREPATPAENAAPIQVNVAAVRRGDISEVLTVTGQTAALTVLRLASPVTGRVTALSVHAGDRLDKGAVAARVIPLENEAALHGFTILEESAALSPAEQQVARRLRHDLTTHDIVLHAPFAAVVADRLHNPGEQVAPNDVLLDLFDPRSLYVLAQVPVGSAPRVGAGMPVDIDGGGIRASGEVAAILAALAPQSLTVPVRVSFTAPLERPLLNAAVRCGITVAHHSNTLLIPRSALMSSPLEDHGIVMVAAAGRAQQRTVQLGLRTQTDIEVTAGLAEGDTVLVEGQYALPDGTAIEPVQAAP